MSILTSPLPLGKILRSFPIETYVVFMVGVIVFVTIHIIDFLTHRWNISIDPRSVLMGPIAGGSIFRYGIFSILIYTEYLLVRFVLRHARKPDGSIEIIQALRSPQLSIFLRSALFWLCIMVGFAGGYAAALSALFRNFSKEAMISASDLLLGFDKAIFGVHPPFFLHTLGIPSMMQTVIADSYVYLAHVLGLCFAYSFFTRRQLLREFFLALVISTYIAFPFWILFPAIAPLEMYRGNIFSRTLSPEIIEENARLAFSPFALHRIDQVDHMWLDIKQQSFSVSSFPSMHVTWATIILYVAYAIRRWLGAILSIFYLTNFVATLFLLEHYAVDSLLGIIVGTLAIVLAKYVLRLETHYFRDRYELLSVIGARGREM